MNEQEFLTYFESLFDGISETIDMDTEFRYIDEWSSLAGVMFIADMTEKYGINVTVEEMKAAETVGDLYKIYKK